MDYAATILNHLPQTRRGTGFKALLSKLKYLPPSQLDIIVDAYEFGSEAHEGQRRYSGELYITHPVAVAGILADLHMDFQSIAAALMHDVLEDTPMAKEQIEAKFGPPRSRRSSTASASSTNSASIAAQRLRSRASGR